MFFFLFHHLNAYFIKLPWRFPARYRKKSIYVFQKIAPQGLEAKEGFDLVNTWMGGCHWPGNLIGKLKKMPTCDNFHIVANHNDMDVFLTFVLLVVYPSSIFCQFQVLCLPNAPTSYFPHKNNPWRWAGLSESDQAKGIHPSFIPKGRLERKSPCF